MPCVLLVLLVLNSGPDVSVLRWMSPDSLKPLPFAEWRARFPAGPGWQVKPLRPASQNLDLRVDVLVQDSLVPVLLPRLDTMSADLERENIQTALFQVSGSSPESLRAFLQSEQDSGLIAAVLVGDLPVAWFQLIDDWNSNGIRDPDESYEEFPCDLYFMDLDGTWSDSFVRYDTLDSLIPGSDSIYDIHSGDLGPEIGISRLPVSVLGQPGPLLTSYLDRAHSYRTGQLNVFDRALVYIDDDWWPNAWWWDQDVGLLYDNRVSIWDRETTRAADYRPRIDSAAYQWVQLCAHSWPGGHGWKYCQGDSWDWFWANEIPGIDPAACFYNLFACSNVRFVESGYCGGRYVFQTSAGLAAIGSAKTGSMLEFDDFYLPLSQAQPLATAFRQWFDAQAADSIEPWERSWYYGMCLVGDGVLKPRAVYLDAATQAVLNPAPRDTLAINEPVRPEYVVANLGILAADFQVRLNIGTDYSDTVQVSLQPGETDTIAFAEWLAHPPGLVVLACSTMLDHDQRTDNDAIAIQVLVQDSSGITESGPPGFEPAALRVTCSPARSRLDLRLTLARPGQVRVRLLDAAGRNVALLVSAELPAGDQAITADVRHLSSGIYFLMLESPTTSERMPVLLVR